MVQERPVQVQKPATEKTTGSQPRPGADGSTATSVNKSEVSPFQQVGDGDSRHGETLSYSNPLLPEDIWCHIHSLMPMCDAARAASVSHSFLRSWRCHPNLTLNWATLDTRKCAQNVSWYIDKILRNHSGTGLKKLNLNICWKGITFSHLDSWLQVAVTPGIEELKLVLYKKYNFPCSILSDGVGNSIRILQLDTCVFRPTSELGPLTRLTRLELNSVRITGDELECLLSNSHALKQLELHNCNEIIFLKIPSVLQQLSNLIAFCNYKLRVIDCRAPNLSTIDFSGSKIKVSTGQQLQMKKLYMHSLEMINELPPIMPNLETIEIAAVTKVVDAPMLHTKFLYLKHITIRLFYSSYNYFSLVSFFDGCPSLETLLLDAPLGYMEHDSVFDGSSHLRQLPEHRYNCLKMVKILGFSSAKSLIELTCCIVKNALT